MLHVSVKADLHSLTKFRKTHDCMPKSRKRKNQKQARSHPAKPLTTREAHARAPTVRNDYLEARATMRRFLHIDLSIGLAGVVTQLIFQFTISQNFIDSHPHASTIFSIVYGLSLLLISYWAILMYFLAQKHPLARTKQWVLRWFKWKMPTSVLMLTIWTFLNIYVLGVVDIISSFISTHWSSASNWMVNAISTIISLAFSGIVGNFGYDLLKRIVLRKKKS
jgi:hypothetical protein